MVRISTIFAFSVAAVVLSFVTNDKASAQFDIPPGYHAHMSYDGTVIVHHNSNNGIPGAHTGMYRTRIAEGGHMRWVRGDRYGLFGLSPRPWFPRLHGGRRIQRD
jgi:hypothetical protein